MTTKRIRSSPILEALFTSQARIAILELFFVRSSRRHYLREIASLTDLPVRAVQRELARLTEGGILSSEREGNRRYFAPNRVSPVFSELRALMLKTVGFPQVMRESLGGRDLSVQIAVVFGSFASGTDQAESDIDLLVIGTLSGRELSSTLRPAVSTLDREINPVLMRPAEIREKYATEDPFVRRIFDEPLLFIKGDKNELEEMVGIRTADSL